MTWQEVAILILLLITVIGVIWAVVRERHLVHMHGQQTHAIIDVDRTMREGTEAIREGFHELTRQVERSDQVSEARRQELIRLILDSERRCADTMRDLLRNLQISGVTIQNSTGGGAANQAGHNEQRQQY